MNSFFGERSDVILHKARNRRTFQSLKRRNRSSRSCSRSSLASCRSRESSACRDFSPTVLDHVAPATGPPLTNPVTGKPLTIPVTGQLMKVRSPVILLLIRSPVILCMALPSVFPVCLAKSLVMQPLP
ncbi:hypothetical protein DPMN_057921 [Dreissena polymorpha]|uniref:Uncharacterized protein n=1 Tax=Dreissena polymorpha TaxID=45954 RepID=A0A9D4C115_DREPO|nr:hypothetical protein DPMN_057921 [Dreissena polymorpha]